MVYPDITTSHLGTHRTNKPRPVTVWPRNTRSQRIETPCLWAMMLLQTQRRGSRANTCSVTVHLGSVAKKERGDLLLSHPVSYFDKNCVIKKKYVPKKFGISIPTLIVCQFQICVFRSILKIEWLVERFSVWRRNLVSGRSLIQAGNQNLLSSTVITRLLLFMYLQLVRNRILPKPHF